MSFSSISSFRSGSASPSKTPIPFNNNNNSNNANANTNTVNNASLSPLNQQQSSSVLNQHQSNYIPWTTNQGKLYKSVGEEAWKKSEKVVIRRRIVNPVFIQNFILFYLEC